MAKLEKLISRRLSLLTRDMFFKATGDSEMMSKVTGFPDAMANGIFMDADYFYDNEWDTKTSNKYQDSNPKIFWDFISKGYVVGDHLWQYIRQNYQTLKNVDDFRYLNNQLMNISYFVQITHPLSVAIEKNILGILKSKGIEEHNLMDALLEISTPIKLNGPNVEALELKEIANKMNLDSAYDWQQALKSHTQKWAYLGYRDAYSAGFDYDFFLKRIHEAEEKHTHTTKLPNLIFTPDEQNYVDLMREFVFFRNYRTEILYGSFYYAEFFWKRLALSHGLAEQDLGYYSMEEAERLLTEGSKLTDTELAVRKTGVAVNMENSVRSIITGQALTELQQQFDQNHSAHDQIKGLPACRGQVTGTVKVVHGSTNQHKVNEGDILVTSMTTPDFLPSMKKAAAFVTDEGGITCHAAIIAREFNKPCIIGTKNASKILKDGDMVEVNADKGIVKILN